MLKFMYGIDILDIPGSSSEKIFKAAQMYTVADKYAVDSLLQHSLDAFKQLAIHCWVDLWLNGQLTTLIRTIYSTNPSAQSKIRGATVHFTCEYIKRFNEPSAVVRFRTLLEEIPEFGADMAIRLSKQHENFKSAWAKTQLHTAAQDGDVALCRKLIAEGADVDGRDERGETPLHFAAWFGQLDALKYLIEAGADINASSQSYASTPLQWAIQRGHGDIREYLISQGAEEQQDEDA
jgi:Ankyrin repeats (3 copies)